MGSLPKPLKKETVVSDAIQVGGMWFQVIQGRGTVSMVSRQHGRYTGMVINTTGGKQVLFSHNGHRYQGKDIRATFTKMVEREIR